MTSKKRIENEKIHPIKQYDTGSKFTDFLQEDGVPVDLDGGSVRFVMRTQSGTTLIDAPATVLQTGQEQDDTIPNVEYLPLDGDLQTPGVHYVEWHCVTRNGRLITLPRGSYRLVEVVATLISRDVYSSSSSSE